MAPVTVAVGGPVTRARTASDRNPGARTGTATDASRHPENRDMTVSIPQQGQIQVQNKIIEYNIGSFPLNLVPIPNIYSRHNAVNPSRYTSAEN